MQSSIHADLLQRIKESGQSLSEIAEGSGVPIGTLSKIVHGHTPDPRLSTAEKILRYLDDGVPGADAAA